MTIAATPVTPITEVIPLLSTAPNRQTDTEDQFSDKADTFASEWEGIPPSQNTLSGQMNTIAAQVNANADASFVNATDAENALAQAIGTSVTSVTIGLGAETWTTQTGLQFIAGQSVRISEDADPVANHVLGTITDYITGTGQLDVFIDTAIGSGTFTAWSITTVAQPSVSIEDLHANALSF